MSTSEPTGLPDHLQVLRVLGRGGMGIVYLATDLRDGQKVAVKVLRDIPGCEDELSRRLGVEARAQTRIRHPNVVEIREAELEASPPFLVMEYVEGETLQQLLERDGPMAGERAVEVIFELSGAVAAMHATEILHRDLKPANVMIRARDGKPVLMDLGLARLLGERTVTKTGALIGTPAYVPPEVLQGEPFCQASDQYQLAALLYEMLTARPLLDVRSLEELLAGPADDLVQRLDDLPVRGQVRRTLRRALRSNPQTRHRSVAAFAEALTTASRSQLEMVKQVDLTAEITRSQQAPPRARRRQEAAPARLPPRLAQGVAAGVLFGVAITAWLLRGGAPEDVRWRVVADALLLDVVPGSATGLQLELDGQPVEARREETPEGMRLVFRGLVPDAERWARLVWDGGQGPRISVVGSEPALRHDVRLVEADAVEVEVVRPVAVGWRGHGEPTSLGAGTAWLPMPPETRDLTLEWVEDGVAFELPLALDDLLRHRLQDLITRVRRLDVPARLEQLYREGGGMDAELPALRRELGSLASRLPGVLSGKLAGVSPHDLWETLDQVQRIAPTARILGEVVPDMPYPREQPGSRMYRTEVPAGIAPPLRLVDGRGAPSQDREVLVTTPKGLLLPRGPNERAGTSAEFLWPGRLGGQPAVIWIQTRKLAPPQAFRLRVPGAPDCVVHLWGDPRGTGGEPRFTGWLGFYLPAPMAPPAGTPVRVEFDRLVGESTAVGVIADLRVAPPPG